MSWSEIGQVLNSKPLNFIFKFLQFIKIYPNIIFSKNPFKIVEFFELTKDMSNDKKTSQILDIGSGFGLQTVLLSKWGNVIGIDPYSNEINEKLHKKYKKVKFYKNRLEEIYKEFDSFDYIFSFSVLEHIPNYIENLEIAFSLLKPNGKLIFSCDALESIKNSDIINQHRTNHNVVKYFKRNELKNILEKIGFKNVEIYPLFTNDFAKEKFIEGIKNNFNNFNYINSYFLSKKLRKKETLDDNKSEGLFLIVKADK
jgi:2-polyprenyl-3-methyl-5-hydroxy-6-metoxy-1,4-benzoquinol methylase